ncbi:hypothetical protein [Pseudomonas sp. TCU-HL1]|uniref:hypothetical protein n=1 Tax=Pseudomonas sp. TCU-HL1 TaxID=1856685 RepID=UPI000856E3F0|nr:hypothetical protein [Pseudomonas sp. TCU-HL1]AOE88106.1 hypothetical protein THL1_5559 [Pseudomonas sp. TCU-HL1]
MIFARRYLQRALNDLRSIIDSSTVKSLAHRLNRPGKDRLAVMWEVAVLHALSGLGNLRCELPLPSGRCPDLAFDNGDLAFTADITVVSDEGLDEQNPFQELSNLIEACKTRLGLPIGGMELRAGDCRELSARGTKTRLKLPPANRLAEFVRTQVEPQLKAQIAAGNKILEFEVENESTSIQVTIDPSRSPYNSGSHAAYDIPTIKDRNPLFNALRAKAKQLRGAEGITGIIVGDGDSRTLSDYRSFWNEVSAKTIAEDFLRQHTSVNFVLLLSVREGRRNWLDNRDVTYSMHGALINNRCHDISPGLELLLREMVSRFPSPVSMPVNGATQSRDSGYGLGFHGGHEMSGNRVRISARELLEILAGRCTAQEMNLLHDWSSLGSRDVINARFNPFEVFLNEGRLPSSVTVVPGGEDESDDWLEFEFGNSDPAISPFY